MSEPQHVWWCPVNEEWHGYACDDGDHDDENWHDKGDPPDVEHHAVRPETLATLTRDLASARTALDEMAEWDDDDDNSHYAADPVSRAIAAKIRARIDALAGEGGA